MCRVFVPRDALSFQSHPTELKLFHGPSLGHSKIFGCTALDDQESVRVVELIDKSKIRIEERIMLRVCPELFHPRAKIVWQYSRIRRRCSRI